MAYLHWLAENYPNDPLTTAEEDAEIEDGFILAQRDAKYADDALELFLTQNDD
jgi:hypothetical protein